MNLHEQLANECTRTTALPSIAALTSQTVSLLNQQLQPPARPTASPSLPSLSSAEAQLQRGLALESVLSDRFLSPARQWRSAYQQSWQPAALRADVLAPESAHVLTATRRPQTSSADMWAADEFSMPVRSLLDQSKRTIPHFDHQPTANPFHSFFSSTICCFIVVWQRC
jgi:hypothetical protein